MPALRGSHVSRMRRHLRAAPGAVQGACQIIEPRGGAVLRRRRIRADARPTSRARRAATDRGFAHLQALIVGARSAFRRHPGDLPVVGFLDVTRLAVHAIGCIDLQPAAAARRRPPSRTRSPGRNSCRDCRIRARSATRTGGIRHVQMHRLVLIMGGCGEEYEGQRGRAAAVRARPSRVRATGTRRGAAARSGRHDWRASRAASRRCRLEHGIGEPQPQAALESGPDVAHLVQFAAADRCAPARVETRCAAVSA